MSTSDGGQSFLQEFRTFLKFLQSLWGMLTGISIFFPLSNILARVIPLQSGGDGGAFFFLSPALVTTVTTLVTLFVVFLTFSRRRELSGMRRKALSSFLFGIVLLAFYVGLYYSKAYYAFAAWGWESEDPRHLLVEIPLSVAYAAFFALTTRAFTLLGLLEFYGTGG